ncbi:sodium/bile acid cotransporter [Lingula anatina]|uniref:Sodium/bile acid cotransporter n=1 Tax=Lingula anatina TaxID=7574 RepID=A0A1S3ISY8_LINAN|nr:sodium/bile acid cotransporter [Lingula anatina]|eukprot:XP_013401051.1 sodium/bile acid cotransporter [Lingula anatina]
MSHDFNISFDPSHILIVEGQEKLVFLNFSCPQWRNFSVHVAVTDVEVASVLYIDDRYENTVGRNATSGTGSSLENFTTSYRRAANDDSNTLIYRVLQNNNFIFSTEGFKNGSKFERSMSCSGQLLIKGLRLGRTDITLNFYKIAEKNDNVYTDGAHLDDNTTSILKVYEDVVVIRKRRPIDTAFRVVTSAFVAFLTMLMGCTLDMGIVRDILKKPLAPAIGFASQYVLMPLLAFAVGQITQIEDAFGLGLLTIGCSPGGGSSNVWTILLGGELELSITMTFLSTCVSLGVMPLWLFLLGRFYIDESKIKIPYASIAVTIASLVGPILIGILFRLWKPHMADKTKRLIRPLALIFIVYVYSFGVYVNLYMWILMGKRPRLIGVGALTPWCGFLFGFVIAKIFRQPRKRAITISLETGIQNIGIPILILQFSLAQPEGDLAAIFPIIQSICQMFPPISALIALTIKHKCFDKGKKFKDAVEKKDGNEKGVRRSKDKEKLPADEEEMVNLKMDMKKAEAVESISDEDDDAL